MKTTVLIADARAAGVTLTLDPGNPLGLRHRPRSLPPHWTSLLITHKPQVLQLLRVESELTPDALDLFNERLGIAAELGMCDEPGSVAWNIAEREARAAMHSVSGKPRDEVMDPFDPRHLASLASAVLGVSVKTSVLPVGQRFAGEPDWSAVPDLFRTTKGGPR